MSRIKGKQLYGFRRLVANLKIARHKELEGLSLKHFTMISPVNIMEVRK